MSKSYRFIAKEIIATFEDLVPYNDSTTVEAAKMQLSNLCHGIDIEAINLLAASKPGRPMAETLANEYAFPAGLTIDQKELLAYKAREAVFSYRDALQAFAYEFPNDIIPLRVFVYFVETPAFKIVLAHPARL